MSKRSALCVDYLGAATTRVATRPTTAAGETDRAQGNDAVRTREVHGRTLTLYFSLGDIYRAPDRRRDRAESPGEA